MLKIILHLVQITVFISLQIIPDEIAAESLVSKNKVEIQVKKGATVAEKEDSKDLNTDDVHEI